MQTKVKKNHLRVPGVVNSGINSLLNYRTYMYTYVHVCCAPSVGQRFAGTIHGFAQAQHDQVNTYPKPKNYNVGSLDSYDSARGAKPLERCRNS